MPNNLIIGPILSEAGRYFFRTWDTTNGLRTSYQYDRYDDARHDRDSTRFAQRDFGAEPQAVDTVIEFDSLRNQPTAR